MMRSPGSMPLSLILIALAGDARAVPTLSAEVLLPDHGQRDAYCPAVARGAKRYLVVWQAGRATRGDIVACPVDLAGKPEGGAPVLVSGAADDQEAPEVAFGQSTFLVVWQDLRGGKDYDVYGARLDEGGKLLDPQGVLISGGAGNQSSPRVAFDGTTFVVVWEDYRSGQRYDIYGARVALDGKVLDPAGIKLAGSDKAGRHRVAPALARSKGGGVLVEWNGHLVNGVGQLAGGLLLAGGAITKTFVIDGKTGETPGDRHTPVRAAGSSSGYVLVWRNYVPVGRVDPSGNPNLLQLDPAGSVTSRSVVGSTGIVDPDVTWDGSASLVAWHEQRGKGDTKQHTGPSDAVYLQRLASGATEISVAGTFASPARRARLASGGDGETLVVYERHPEQATTPIRIGVRLAH